MFGRITNEEGLEFSLWQGFKNRFFFNVHSGYCHLSELSSFYFSRNFFISYNSLVSWCKVHNIPVIFSISVESILMSPLSFLILVICVLFPKSEIRFINFVNLLKKIAFHFINFLYFTFVLYFIDFCFDLYCFLLLT